MANPKQKAAITHGLQIGEVTDAAVTKKAAEFEDELLKKIAERNERLMKIAKEVMKDALQLDAINLPGNKISPMDLSQEQRKAFESSLETIYKTINETALSLRKGVTEIKDAANEQKQDIEQIRGMKNS
jgi:hypothetical protein